MKTHHNLSKVLCALGVSTILFTGIASAKNMHPENAMSINGMNKHSMMMPGMGTGVGNVMPGIQSSQVDYVGAVTTLKRYYPNAMVTSISYDAKHHPTYEVEAFTNTQKIEMEIDEATGQIVSNKAKILNRKSGKKRYSFDPQNTIIPESAETKAIKQVGTEFQTMEWELKTEGKKVVYELEMTDGADKKADVKVDAMSGKVLSTKIKNTKR